MKSEETPGYSKHCSICDTVYDASPIIVCPRDGQILMPHNPPDGDRELPARYGALKEIASGTISTVYEGVDTATDTPVAIKMLRVGARDPQASRKKERFIRQVDAHKFLAHPNIVKVLNDDTTSKGIPFIVFELVVGGLSLADLQGQLRDLPLSYFKTIFIEVCDALEFSHSKNVLHQDLSPGDILIGKTENDGIEVKVTDFAKGAALIHGENQEQQSTARKDLFGNASFMSPEVGLSNPLTAVSNVYSLGCIMYSVLSTREPFEGMHWAAIMLKKINDDQLPLELKTHDEVSKIIEALVAKCLKVSPDARYQSINEVKKVLQKLPIDKSKTRYSVISSVLKTRLNR